MAHSLHIACAQMNPIVGDIEGNLDKMLTIAGQAQQANARLVIFPELCVTAYPPEDLLLRDDFMDLVRIQARRLASFSRDIAIIAGMPVREQGMLFNSACFFDGGKLVSRYDKRILPNYAVFDEQRYFTAGSTPHVIELDHFRLGVIICEDVWQPLPAVETREAGAQVIISINASPFYIDKHEQRIETLKQRTADIRLPIIYVNQVGGQDELVFDGSSCIVSAASKFIFTAPAFETGLYYCRLQTTGIGCDEPQVPQPGLTELIWKALVMGLRDYIKKNPLHGVVLGLSGGIDSAVSLVLAVEALGAERVTAVLLPSPYTSEMSIKAARQLAEGMGVLMREINITPIFSVILEQLAPLFSESPKDITEENIQSRIRGLLLMAIANKYQLGLLATGNKSEMATGYATLYGDMAGAFAPLKDVVKTRVYELARFCNRDREVIPTVILERPATAELAFGQTDQDTLPPYEILDPIIEAFIEKDESYAHIVKQGFPSEIVKQVQSMILNSEFKRRQSPPGVKVTSKAFGKDRRYPISSYFKPGE